MIYIMYWTTRFLGRPQPQMYPPVALNWYNRYNITHTHFIYIYASRPHKHCKIDFIPKLSSQQHVTYGNNLMNISYNFVSIWGGGGGVLKTSSPFSGSHTRGTEMSANADLITVETYVQQGKQFESQFFIFGPKC